MELNSNVERWMAKQDGDAGVNRPQLSLHVPEPEFRPGDAADFSALSIPEAGAQFRPDEACHASETWPLFFSTGQILYQ